MRILLVYYEPRSSGQTTHVLSLARGADLCGWQVTVVLPDHLWSAIADLEQAGARVVPLPMAKIRWPLRAVVALARLIRTSDFDLVHVHSQEAGLIGRPVARLAGARRIVYTPQTLDIRQVRWSWLYRLVEVALAWTTAAIVSVNEADRRRLIGWQIPAAKIVTIANGIDLAKFEGPVDREALCRELDVDAARPLVMQVGRLSAQKNPLAFVDGAACVLRQQPGAQFALVGDGPLRAEVAARIEALGLDRHVRLLGWHDRAFRLLAAADVVTLTSCWEGAPYALLEAMAWARPVVATAVNGCPEIVAEGRTGFLTAVGDAGAWARAVTRLLDDRTLAAAMGQRGRRRVEENFALPHMLARLEELYRQV